MPYASAPSDIPHFTDEITYYGSDQHQDKETFDALRDDYKRLLSEFGDKDSTSIKHPVTKQSQSNNQSVGAQELYSVTINKNLPQVDDIVAPLSKRRPSAFFNRGRRSLHPLVEWEGYVEQISDDSFVARLVNVDTGDSLPEDEAIFSKSELSEYQLSHLEPGAIFRWVIGMQRLPSGQKQRVSEVFFRRLPAHSAEEIKVLTEQAATLIESIDWDEASQP